MPSPPSSRAALPAAGSTLTSGVLRSAPRRALVLGAHRLGLYLSVDGSVLPVVPSDAVALPTAVRLGARSAALPGPAACPWGVEAGDHVRVGGGRVALPAADVVLVRSWRPARVRRLASGAACPGDRGAVAGLLADACTDEEAWLLPAVTELVSSLARVPEPEDETGSSVAGLVGRGRGLTPSGDDALAGVLLVSHALRASLHLAATVRARLGSTTAVSAALLGAAGDGFAAGPVVTLVDAVLVGHVEATARALPAVLGLGHSSGRDLVTGVLAALLGLAGTDVAGAATPVAGTPTARGRATIPETPTGRSAA